MAEIPGVTIDFTDYSAPGTPRIANIPDGVGDVTVQDLWDTFSEIASRLDNLIYKKLIDRPAGGGKSTLSATKAVGITLMQNNLQTKFFDQPGPAYVIKRVTDGNLIAQDDVLAELEALASSDFTNWKNEADVSGAIITAIEGSGLTTAESDALQLILDIMEGDHVETNLAVLINKKGTEIPVLAKQIIGSLLQPDIEIRTEEQP